MLPSPERSHKWLGLLLPLVERGGPILSLFLLIVSVLMVYWLLGALKDQQQLTRSLAERLLTCVSEKGELLYKYRAPAPD